MFLVLAAFFVMVAGVAVSRLAPDPLARRAGLAGGAALSVLLVIVSAITVIPAGHIGVIDFFGNVSDRVLQPGVRLVNPLVDIHKLSVRTRELTETANVPSSEGLVVSLDVTLL